MCVSYFAIRVIMYLIIAASFGEGDDDRICFLSQSLSLFCVWIRAMKTVIKKPNRLALLLQVLKLWQYIKQMRGLVLGGRALTIRLMPL